VEQFGYVDDDFVAPGMVQVKDAKFLITDVAENAVLVHPVLGKGNNCNKIGRHGCNRCLALYEAP
jgi:hypothetical protein